MRRVLPIALMLTLVAAAAPAQAQPIPPHPEKIRFKPFTYTPPSARDHRVVLPRSKVVAYLAVDKELPLVNVQVLARVGSYLEPPGKEGLADLTGYLMTRGGVGGKRPMSAEALEERLAFLAAVVTSGVSDTQGTVSMNLLSKDLDEGLRILRDVLAAPHFDEKRLALRKDQLINQMKQRNDDAAELEARERRMLSFGPDHYTNRLPTKASIDAIRREDLIAFHRRYFHPQHFIVAAAGDFDREQMIQKLDEMLLGWPAGGEKVSAEIPKPTRRPEPGLYLVDKRDVTQGRVSVLLPGIQRDDPDYFAVQVMNQILGGGGFTSRITNRVRSDEGLAYHASSRFAGGVYYPDVFMAVFQSKLRSCSYATSIVLEEIRRMREGAVTKEEMAAAKKQLVEQLPQLFRTKTQTVNTLAQEEFTGRYQRDPDYFQRYQERVEKITDKDVQRVAQKWLDDKAVAILVVGKKEDLLNPDPRHPIAFPSLTGGKMVQLPLRDPLTLQPMPLKAAPAAKAPQ